MTSVLLATCAALPHGEPGGSALLEACSNAGLDARWVAWDDADVRWADADLVAVRSTWDYEDRLPEFLAWARSVGPRLLNGADVFAWNLDKRYLLELAAAGVPVVPTVVALDRGELAEAVGRWPAVVVKPCVGAGGRAVVVVADGDAGAVLDDGPWLVQPLVESVRTEGEHSVYVMGGEPVSQFRKLPVGEEVRVHEQYGGSTVPVPLDPELAALARRTVTAAEGLLGRTLTYGRVDVLRLEDGSWALGELEATEPGLYLDVVPENAVAFARVLAQTAPA